MSGPEGVAGILKLAVAHTGLWMGVLLVAEARGSRVGVWIAKPLASTGFVATALAAGALGSPYGRAVLGALVLSWLGDLLLIPRGRPRVFLAGVLSFLLAHLAFAGAFLLRATSLYAALVALALTAGLGGLVTRWLRPRLPATLRGPVRAYVLAISLMLSCAAATLGGAAGGTILLGAALFYVSDLAVARDRFVRHSVWNRAWGLPLYFGGQLILATTTGL